ncbi:MAG: ion transporter, partial [Chromatiales bacterium]|nr:ion transporter [Chromatiales bacterium]
PFILIATFTMLNLFIGVVVSAMQSYHDTEAKHMEETRSEHAELLTEVRALRADLQALKSERGDG